MNGTAIRGQAAGRMRFGLRWVLAVVLALPLAGCDRQETSAPRVLEPLAVCTGGPAGLLLFAAEAAEYLRQEGLGARIATFPQGKDAFEAMLAGRCDAAFSAQTPVVAASFSRHDIRVIASVASSDNHGRILARGDHGIRRIEDLRGKRIAVSAGTTHHYILDAFQTRYGLREEELRLVFMDTRRSASALEKGEIDAVAGSDISILPPQRALGGKAVVFEAPRVMLVNFTLTAQDKTVRSRAMALEKLLRALARAEPFVRGQPDRAIELLAARIGSTEAEVASLWNNYRWRLALDQRLLLGMEEEAAWMLKRGVAKGGKVPNYLGLVDSGILRRAKPEAVTLIE